MGVLEITMGLGSFSIVLRDIVFGLGFAGFGLSHCQPTLKLLVVVSIGFQEHHLFLTIG
jgi:hypothetical protein